MLAAGATSGDAGTVGSTVERGPQRPGRVIRLVQALPAIAFLGTFGFFFIDKHREARSVLRSGRGLLTVAAIVVGYVAVGFLVRRLVRWAWLSPAVLTAVVIGLAAWIVLPYYDDDTVERQLVTGPVRDVSELTAEPTTVASEPSGATVAPSSVPPTPPTTSAPAPGPVRIASGPIAGLGHDASGTVSVIRNPDRSLVVRFEDFAIEGTPDPRLYLVEGRDVRQPGGVDLGSLEGNQGRVLDYDVPAGTDIGAGWTVLVWCRSFSVPIANAPQSPT